MESDDVVYLTKGVLANLCATGHIDQILTTFPYKCATTNRVLNTFPSLWDISLESEKRIDCQDVVSKILENGKLHICSPQGNEYNSVLVMLSSRFRDELAEIFALVSVQNAAVALDDPVLRKRLLQPLPGISIHSTLAILKKWLDATSLPCEEAQIALRNVSQRAHFSPPDDDPLLPWWRHFFC